MIPMKNYIGIQFGQLTVLDELEPHITPNGSKQRIVKCQCSCGEIFNVRLTALKQGKVQCIKCENANRRVDLSGERFGRLLVTSMVDDYISPQGHHLARCLCKCDCGNEIIVNMCALVNGNTRSCGCLRHEIAKQTKTVDLSGKRFGALTVLFRVGDHITTGGNHHHMYRCRCDCGKELDVQGGLLKNGNVKSCGCMRNSWISKSKQLDLTGMRFGKLTVLFQTNDYISPSGTDKRTRWHCRCDCGNECDVTSHSLQSGFRISCGCESMSHAEHLVNQFLQDKGYALGTDYVQQIKFDDLIGVGQKKLSYDFCIYDSEKIKYLLECQGQQHFKSINLFGGEKQFEIQKIHDDLKRQYAKSEDITLIEIPYTVNSKEKVKLFLEEYGL